MNIFHIISRNAFTVCHCLNIKDEGIHRAQNILQYVEKFFEYMRAHWLSCETDIRVDTNFDFILRFKFEFCLTGGERMTFI